MEEMWPPPFGPAEWERLRLLDRRCRISFERYNRDTVEPRTLDRVWIVSIHLRDGMAYEDVRAIRRSLKQAVIEALDECERKGWHRPRDAGKG